MTRLTAFGITSTPGPRHVLVQPTAGEALSRPGLDTVLEAVLRKSAADADQKAALRASVETAQTSLTFLSREHAMDKELAEFLTSTGKQRFRYPPVPTRERDPKTWAAADPAIDENWDDAVRNDPILSSVPSGFLTDKSLLVKPVGCFDSPLLVSQFLHIDVYPRRLDRKKICLPGKDWDVLGYVPKENRSYWEAWAADMITKSKARIVLIAGRSTLEMYRRYILSNHIDVEEVFCAGTSLDKPVAFREFKNKDGYRLVLCSLHLEGFWRRKASPCHLRATIHSVDHTGRGGGLEAWLGYHPELPKDEIMALRGSVRVTHRKAPEFWKRAEIVAQYGPWALTYQLLAESAAARHRQKQATYWNHPTEGKARRDRRNQLARDNRDKAKKIGDDPVKYEAQLKTRRGIIRANRIAKKLQVDSALHGSMGTFLVPLSTSSAPTDSTSTATRSGMTTRPMSDKTG
ncbi:hypothetical protein P153DRAFT_356070 [Dothidotthia symphoricarpi CBS 119687]|uniref:Uncharacterized protein n=1 Tax=Dothidotthia symphoricarpi CBS 119687 TaxID=1392245 RepID=A0A6A6AGM4_9PLEO|nr:uncharacterized protein P153DRAFT_356070 [Dothidotthia symphoricarpi CBS 119687]KAF2130275.1 hypothetical protein P153DRAFT_356070 [Dothidotthia symphoricarpi CBS 119687]